MTVRETNGPTDQSSPLEKVFHLLRLMAERRDAMGLGELAREMKLPKTTLHRITRQLEELGYLAREPGGRRLAHSQRMIELAVDILACATAQAERHSIIQDLSEALGESCCIGARVGYEIVYLDDVVAPEPLTMRFIAGQRAPLHCTSQGKIHLAHMSAKEWETYTKRATLTAATPHTITDFSRLAGIVRDPGCKSFACSDREFNEGVVGAAVPVTGARNKLYATLSFAAPSTRMSMEQVRETRPALEQAAERLSATF